MNRNNNTYNGSSMSHELTALNMSMYYNIFITDDTSNDHEDDNDSNEEEFPDAVTPFPKAMSPILWYTNTFIECRTKKVDEKRISYTIPHGFHLLSYTVYVQPIPKLWIPDQYKNDYRIKWTDDICIHTNILSELRCGNIPLPMFDNYYMLDKRQFDRDSNNEHSTQKDMGNCKEITGWNSILPSTELKMSHPWFYTKDDNAFPLYELNEANKLTHILTLNNNVSSLLCMQQRDESGKWRDIKVDLTKIEGLNSLENNKLPQPKFYASVSHITKKQIAGYRRNNPSSTFYIEDVLMDSKPGDNIVSFELPNINALVNSIYFKAQNSNSLVYNNYSNFTSHRSIKRKGEDPTQDFSVDYDSGSGVKINSLPTYLFSGQFVKNHYKSTPVETGYHAWTPLCSTSQIVDSGISLRSKTRVSISIKDAFTYKDYNVMLRTEVMKEIRFERGAVIIPNKQVYITK